MRQGADSPRELSHTLPHTLLSSCLPVYLRGHLVADAAMRALLVVETDEAGYAVTGILLALESMLAVNDLGLKDTVHTLGYGIVRRLVIFCHADSYFVFKKFFRIGIATVLYTSVRVVDEVVQSSSVACSIAIWSARSVYCASSVSDRHQPTILCE